MFDNRQLHFRCSFRLTPDVASDDIWEAVVKTVRTWVVQKFDTQEGLLGRWFFTGGSWIAPGNPRVTADTRVAIASGTPLRPAYWSLRLEHPCSDLSFRQWRIDITLSPGTPTGHLFSLVVTHCIHSDYAGEIPDAPMPSAPRLVTTLLRNRRWTVLSGSLPLESQPISLNVGEGKAFWEALADPQRGCPVILITRQHHSGSTCLNPTALMRLLVGTASIYVASDVEVDKELEWCLPTLYRCYNGMVRIYQPQLRPSSPSDYRRHRFFLPQQIAAESSAKIMTIITWALSRNARSGSFRVPLSIDDVAAKDREARLQELLRSGQSVAELETLFKEVTASQEADLATLEKENNDLVIFAQELERERDEYRDSHKQFEHHLEKLGDLQRQRDELIAGLDAFASLSTLPTSVLAVVETIGALYPSRLCFTDRAFKSARRSSLGDHNVAWRCLWSMANVLHSLFFEESFDPAQIVRVYKERSGFDLSFTETGLTKQSKGLMSHRQDSYDGREIDITPHVKYGSKNPSCLRVHFHVHRGERRLIIGHVGDHLETSGTRRRS